MNAQLNRLQAFLADAGELEIVAPPPAVRPDYFSRFAKILAPALLAGHLVAPQAGATSGTPEIPAADVVATQSNTATRQALSEISQISARYLAHGRSPLQPRILMLNPSDSPDEGPMAIAVPGEICIVKGVRGDYSKTEPRLAAMADTAQMRAMVLVHESMHCRLGPALLRHVAATPFPMATSFTQIFSESSADAMAVLTLARRDGIPDALKVLDRMVEIRAEEAASADADGFHDTRETLARVRALLVNQPSKLASDADAFKLAITEAMGGSATTFKASLPADKKDYISTPEFRSDMTGFHKAVEEMGRDYLDGKHEMSSPEISLGNTVLQSGAAASSSVWQMLAKRVHPDPGFTAAGLRGQAEAITAEVIAANAGVSAGVGVNSQSAVAIGSPAPQATLSQAVGRLRSRIGSVYEDTLRPEIHVPGNDETPDEAPRPAM
ncbi:hypothetical protein JAB5_27050 [Janthinobacterium sp. HH103]|uniref:hypothetical protein n=1 Tax=unclassified Janthinobacterium TaxID=2610881 RepID=UPI000894001A|nr:MULTISPECIES: hypothetical protein [unclassified Janthinobacterium]OEZ69264.1 hypothetical protein JAB2_14500 [Janthinobacterium sp. HH100]OEZ76396.1 hypothetical protein JAB5_27050 [Janthinobacterium sp. HH103]QOU76237.1 hypothetical protein JAB4_057370 [Janthinobacterium sp. HH102]